MPITKVIIENFKGIRDRVEIPIRPLTLLFGANSAGKTTVLHALLYLRELLERQNADADRVIGGGKDIYLGGFRQLVHGHDESKTVTVGVEFELDEDGLDPYPIPRLLAEQAHHDWQNGHFTDAICVEGLSGITSVTVEVSTAISQITKQPEVACYSVSINGVLLAEISGNLEMRAVLNKIALDHPIFADQFSHDDPDDDQTNPIVQAIRSTFYGAQLNTIARTDIGEGWIALGHQVIPKWGQPLDIDIDEDPIKSDVIQAPFTKFILSQLMVRPGELVLDYLGTYRHLGPIRAVPDLSSIAQRSPSADRWIDGLAAWDLLSADALRQDNRGGQLISKVNAYIKDEDKLNLGYSLGVEYVKDIPVDSALAQILERYISSPDDFESEAALRAAYMEALARPTHTKLQLTDLRRNVSVNPSDIGAGVSQVIPVLVSILDSASKVTAIEQPELHLHPAIQCSLGDLFVRAANMADERFFLVETHSEHLLLRLMRRMRETQNDSLPSPDLTLTPETITILFVETYEGRSIYREMPLNERGELVKAWPGGFFEEDMNELL